MLKTATPATVWKLSLKEFVDYTGKKTPLITGGCVVITSACFALSLIRMPLEISRKKEQDEERKMRLSENIVLLKKIHTKLVRTADLDLKIFDTFRFIPGEVRGEEREKLLKSSLVKATELPLKAARLIRESIRTIKSAISLCQRQLISDIGAGAIMLNSAFEALLLLISANINSLPDTLIKKYHDLKNELEWEAEEDMALIREQIDNNKDLLNTL